MHRRDFLRYMAALGLVTGAGRLVLPEEVWAMAPKETPQPLVAKAQGTNYAHLVGDAIQALGGMKKFVNPGEVVVVKPNMAWDRTPEMAANANPVVVRQVVELCLEAGAKKVKVLDHTCHDARKAYANSGIKAAVEDIKDPRAVVEFVDDRRFVELTVEKAKALKKWYFYKDILEADRFINIPVAKHHSESRLTMCLKNMMGAIGGWRGRIHVGLHQNIADMNLLLAPGSARPGRHPHPAAERPHRRQRGGRGGEKPGVRRHRPGGPGRLRHRPLRHQARRYRLYHQGPPGRPGRDGPEQDQGAVTGRPRVKAPAIA